MGLSTKLGGQGGVLGVYTGGLGGEVGVIRMCPGQHDDQHGARQTPGGTPPFGGLPPFVTYRIGGEAVLAPGGAPPFGGLPSFVTYRVDDPGQSDGGSVRK